MPHIESKLKVNDGNELFYQIWEAEKTPMAVICLVHGLGEHSGRYTYVAQAMNKRGYHVMAFDLYGHGRSPGKRGDIPPYSVINDHAAKLLEQAAQRYPGLTQVLYGHSLGGLIVMNYCLTCMPSVKGVIITSPGLCTALEEQKGKILMVKLLGGLLPGLSIPSGLDAKSISRDPDVVERYVNDPLVHDKATLQFAKNSLTTIQYIFAHVAEWKLPLLLMHGTEDKLAYSKCSEKVANMMKPGICTLRLWPGLYHELHNEPEKDEVLAYMIEYLDRLTTSVA